MMFYSFHRHREYDALPSIATSINKLCFFLIFSDCFLLFILVTFLSSYNIWFQNFVTLSSLVAFTKFTAFLYIFIV